MNHIAFALSGLLFIGAPPAASQSFTGTYRGSLWNGGQDSPSTTKLETGPNQTLSGEYSFEERDGRITTGSLDMCRIEAYVLTCRWRDTYGTGLIRMEFDSSFCTFRGQWTTTIVSNHWSYWNGSRGCTPVASANVALQQF